MTEAERQRVAELVADGWLLNVEVGAGVTNLKAAAPEIGPAVRYVAHARRAEAVVTGFGVTQWKALVDLLEQFA